MFRLPKSSNNRRRFKLDKEILWVNRDKPPVDEPPCGFDGSGCTATPDGMKKIASGVLGVVLLLIFLFVSIIYSPPRARSISQMHHLIVKFEGGLIILLCQTASNCGCSSSSRTVGVYVASESQKVNINVTLFRYTRAFGDGPRHFEPWSSDEDDT
ncbi:hypothetical protein TNCV_4110391 [Trichonephila clavipes]|nr:hypothetical protein TNCV_4110391 [Trichonephila clavipes]